MNFKFKEIHIGELIRLRMEELGIEQERVLNFLKCDREFFISMFSLEDISTEKLLKLSKLLEYDFFRIYSQHLILYAPPSASDAGTKKKKITSLPEFRKNIYTQEMINFILGRLKKGEMTKIQVIEEYRIPKTTLYKWIKKHTYET